MQILRSETLELQDGEDIVQVRREVRAWMVELGFGLVDQTKIVTAASELARNAVDHGGGGTVRMETLSKDERKGLRLVFADRGPGIEDLEQALQDGYSSTSGLGLGLGGSRRLVDEFELASRPGAGTCVTVLKWR